MIIMLKIPVSETEKWKRKAKETKQVWHDAKWRKVVQMTTMGLSTCSLYALKEHRRDRLKRPKNELFVQRFIGLEWYSRSIRVSEDFVIVF